MTKKLPHYKPLAASLRIRRLITGDIFFRDGEPKVVPPGYIQDPKQPQVFIQQKPECKHRKIRKCNCSNPVKLEVCDLERPLDCVECEEREI